MNHMHTEYDFVSKVSFCVLDAQDCVSIINLYWELGP